MYASREINQADKTGFNQNESESKMSLSTISSIAFEEADFEPKVGEPGQVTPPPYPKALGQGAIDRAELIADIKRESQSFLKESMEKALQYGDILRKKMLEDTQGNIDGILAKVKTELEGYGKPKDRIIAVKIADVTRKLSKPASPYLPEVLIQATQRLNTYLYGPVGCGKTTLAEQVAEALGLRYGHISLTAGASETWLIGRWTPKGEFIKAQFLDFFENGGVFLIDEIDGADANLLLFVNTALANGSLANPLNGEIIKRHKDFVCIAAGNTLGKGGNAQFTGRVRLDKSTLGRFEGCYIEMDYSDDIEAALCPDKKLRTKLQKARKFLREKKSDELLTTRVLMNAYTLKQAGLDEKRIFEKICLPWSKELAEQSGLLKPEDPSETPAF